MTDIPRPNPKLMVIGDSLPQGCRSMSVNKEFCARSWPARFATEQGIPFVSPDFPRPVLFDLEDEIRSLNPLESLSDIHFPGILRNFRSNLSAWLENKRESAEECFDNLAIAGTLIGDLSSQSAARYHQRIGELTPSGLFRIRDRDGLADLHVAVNGRFVLNPSQNPDFANFSPMDWVRARKPEMLIVETGHNHGLYGVGGSAEDRQPDSNPAAGLNFFDEWADLSTAIAALPADIQTILVMGLPKVGAVANLQPDTSDRTDGYATLYEPVFSASPALLRGERLAGIDSQIRAMNDRMKKMLLDAEAAAGDGRRIQFVDVYDILDRFDFKNSLDGARQIVGIADSPIDNRYMGSRLKLSLAGLKRVLDKGGLQSLDGMHPSGFGYAMLASEVLTKLGVDHDRKQLLKTAFQDAQILTNPPSSLGFVLGVLNIAREARRAVPFDDAARLGRALDDGNDSLSLPTAIEMLRGIFHHH